MYEREGTAKVKVGMFGFLSVLALCGAAYGITAMIFGSPADESPDEDSLTILIEHADGNGDEPKPEVGPEPAAPKAHAEGDDSEWNPEWGDNPNAPYEG